MKTVVEQIQEDDSSYDPLRMALEAVGATESQWKAATDRIYFDGFFGPISPDEWKEQDGREFDTVSDARKFVAKVLDKVDDYRDEDFNVLEDATTIRAALVAPWYAKIYGERYPTL